MKFWALGLLLLILACNPGYHQAEFWGDEMGPPTWIQCWDYTGKPIRRELEPSYKEAWEEASKRVRYTDWHIKHCVIWPEGDSIR